MAYSNLDKGFKASLGDNITVAMVDGQLIGKLAGKHLDLIEYLPQIARRYVRSAAKAHPGQNFMCDIRIGTPAFIGIFFAYRWNGQKFRCWLYTERDEVPLEAFEVHAGEITEWMEPGGRVGELEA